MSPSVLNFRRLTSEEVTQSTFVGRPTKWGNPFKLRTEKERSKVVLQYAEWLLENPSLVSAAQKELKGRSLACYCAPKLCHADVLLLAANASSDPRIVLQAFIEGQR